jgi:hypothetical protein
MGIGYLTMLVLLLSVSITVIYVLLPINALPALVATSRLVVLALSATARFALPLVALHVWMAISLTLLLLPPALWPLEIASSPAVKSTQCPDALLAPLHTFSIVLLLLLHGPIVLAALLLPPVVPLLPRDIKPVVELARFLPLLSLALHVKITTTRTQLLSPVAQLKLLQLLESPTVRLSISPLLLSTALNVLIPLLPTPQLLQLALLVRSLTARLTFTLLL